MTSGASTGSSELIREEEVKARDRETRAGGDVDEIVMCEIHRRPIQGASVRPNIPGREGKEVRDEQCLHGRTAGMQTRERPEYNGSVAECGGVSVGVEQPVNANEASWGAFHRVVRRGQTVDDLVPWRGAGENDLNKDTNEIHIAVCPCPEMQCLLWTKEPEEGGYNERKGKVSQAVRNPGYDIEHGMGKAGEDVGDICTVQDRLQGWEKHN